MRSEDMSKEEIKKFFAELKNNKKAQESLLAENPETLEDLAKVSGGIASSMGYAFSDEELLSYCEDARLRSKAAAATVMGADMAGGDGKTMRGCGALQVLLDTDDFPRK